MRDILRTYWVILIYIALVVTLVLVLQVNEVRVMPG